MKTTADLHIPRQNSSLRQQVTDRLRDAVLSGMFEPGMKLVERDLCEMLGISRTVLREALQHLGAEGLITNVPHKGPMVATITAQEARDIYAVRGALEALAGGARFVAAGNRPGADGLPAVAQAGVDDGLRHLGAAGVAGAEE